MRVALYARAKDAAGIERQRAALREWVKANGLVVAGEYMEEPSQPGRPQFARLVAAAQSISRRFDAIAFTEWSRLSRSVEEIASLRNLDVALLPVAP